uniref:Uncharacterized protein n=1 Tax=Lactuca sativa TaxID=4236 RepID=A0A9R1WIZ9_LACSA|nr:hypothetical protein LSAT_V11C100026020 [Lactuca sativa]
MHRVRIFLYCLQVDITFKKKDAEAFDDDGCYVDFNMDEVDLRIENYEELFGVGHNDPEHLFAKVGIDCLFNGVESNCHGSYAAKESSTGHGNQVQPTCSNAASTDSLISCKIEPNLCYGRQHSNISFSSLTGESNGGEYQDYGASSSILLMGGGVASDQTTTAIGSRSDVLCYRGKKEDEKLSIFTTLFIMRYE